VREVEQQRAKVAKPALPARSDLENTDASPNLISMCLSITACAENVNNRAVHQRQCVTIVMKTRVIIDNASMSRAPTSDVYFD